MSMIHVLLSCCVCSAALAQQEGAPTAVSDLSPEERRAYFGRQSRWPPTEHGGLIFEISDVSVEYSVPNRLSAVPKAEVTVRGTVHWTPEGGDVLIAAPMLIQHAEGHDGEPIYEAPDDLPIRSGIITEWVVDADRSHTSPLVTTSVLDKLGGLAAVPSHVRRMEGLVRVWRLKGATTTAVPLRRSGKPLELAPGVHATVTAGEDETGHEALDITIAHPAPTLVHGVEFPAVLFPDSLDFLDADGAVVRGIDWGTPPAKPDDILRLEASGHKVHRWRLLAPRGRPFPEGVSLRIRVVPEAVYEPIAFSIADVPITGEPPLPPGATPPRRTFRNGPLRLTFFDPGPGSSGGSVYRDTVILRPHLTNSQPSMELDIASNPTIRQARDASGGDMTLVPTTASSEGGEYSSPRPGGLPALHRLSVRLQTEPEIDGIELLEGVWPIWRVTDRLDYQFAAEALREPIEIVPGLRVAVRQVTRSAGKTQARIRWYVETERSDAGLELPILSPLYFRDPSEGGPLRSTTAGPATPGHDANGQYVQRTYSAGSTNTDLEFVVSIVRAVEDLSIDFAVTDMPLSR